MQKAHPKVQLGRGQKIDLVEDDQVGLLHLRVQQKRHLRGKLRRVLVRHEHFEPLRVYDAGKGHELKLLRLFFQQLQVHVVERTDAAAGNIGEDHVHAAGDELVELVDETGQVLLGAVKKTPLPAGCAMLGEDFYLPLPVGERAVIFGAGHIARSLVPLLRTVGFRPVVDDDRAEYTRA